MSLRARPSLHTSPRGARALALWMGGVIASLALATAGCDSYSVTGGPGAFGTGGGSCEAKLVSCGLPAASCSGSCDTACLQVASCADLDALSARHPPASLVACIQAACSGTSSSSSGHTGSSGSSSTSSSSGGSGTSSSSGSSSGGACEGEDDWCAQDSDCCAGHCVSYSCTSSCLGAHEGCEVGGTACCAGLTCVAVSPGASLGLCQ